MSALSDYLEEYLLNHVFNNGVSAWVALYISDPTDADGGSEVSGGSYARAEVTPNGGASPSWTVATVDAPGYKVTNANDIDFVQATAGWGTVTHVGVRDAASGGHLLYHGAPNNPREILSGDVYHIAAGDLKPRLE